MFPGGRRTGKGPASVGRKGEVLDLGRSARLFSPAQRKAMAIRDQGCTTEGCSIPAAWCEAHHHHRAHDPAWQVQHHPNGSTTFHRRT